MLYASFKDALRWMLGNKLRAAITLIGVAIPALMVTATAGLALGVRDQYRTQLIGDTDFLQVLRDTPTGLQGRTYNTEPIWDSDLEALEKKHDPTLVSEFVPVASGSGWVRYGAKKRTTTITGSTPGWLDYSNHVLKGGANLSWAQTNDGAKVVVLGTDLAKALFDNQADAIGKIVFIGRVGYTVIGLQSDGGNAILPLKTVRGDLLGGTHALTKIGVRLTSPDNKSAASDDLNAIMYAERGLENGDSAHKNFNVDDGIFTWKRWGPLFNIVLWAAVVVGGLLLLLGTFVLLNGMLSTVKERTPEIQSRQCGRYAVFAHLMAESLSIAAIAGVLGTALGVGLILYGQDYLPTLYPDIPVSPALSSAAIALGLGASLTIGLLAGLFPAVRAARVAGAARHRTSTPTRSSATRVAEPVSSG